MGSHCCKPPCVSSIPIVFCTVRPQRAVSHTVANHPLCCQHSQCFLHSVTPLREGVTLSLPPLSPSALPPFLHLRGGFTLLPPPPLFSALPLFSAQGDPTTRWSHCCHHPNCFQYSYAFSLPPHFLFFSSPSVCCNPIAHCGHTVATIPLFSSLPPLSAHANDPFVVSTPTVRWGHTVTKVM